MKMRMRNKQYWFLNLVLIFSGSLSFGESFLGVSFGSPTLVGIRGAYHWNETPWSLQAEYSKQTLHRNRSNGLLSILRLDAQWEYLDIENGIVPFYFAGFDHFSGYPNKTSNSISLLACEFGGGLKLEISERWKFTSEFGFIIPTQFVKGFEVMGLAINLSILFRVGP